MTMTLARRVLSGVVLITILGAALWVGGPAPVLLVAVAAGAGSWEYRGLQVKAGVRPPRWLLYPLTAGLLFQFVLPAGWPQLDAVLGVVIVIGLVGTLLTGVGMVAWATAVGGALYIGLDLGYWLAVASVGDHGPRLGTRLVVLALAGVVLSDTAAYLGGGAVGRRPLFPAVSPAKTVEGALCGLAAAAIAGGVMAPRLVGIPAGLGIGFGLVVSLTSQAGDLVESALKRAAGVKDSSRLIPGHGGVLDRLDSILLVGPMVYGCLHLLRGQMA